MIYIMLVRLLLDVFAGDHTRAATKCCKGHLPAQVCCCIGDSPAEASDKPCSVVSMQMLPADSAAMAAVDSREIACQTVIPGVDSRESMHLLFRLNAALCVLI